MLGRLQLAGLLLLLSMPAALPAQIDLFSRGADPTGAADASAALQACLDAAGPGGTCRIGAAAKPWRLRLLGDVRMPKNTTLDCAAGFPEGGDAADFDASPAILLDPRHTIRGTSGDIVRHCLIVRDGIAFPAKDASRFAGVALADGGPETQGFTVEDSVILGFDTGIWISGARPYIRHVTIDAAGVDKAALELDVGNTDSGYVTDLKIQPMATANTDCSHWTRPGTGLRVAGQPQGAAGVWLDRVVVQPFKTADYDFENSVILGNIWADGITAKCGGDNSVGVIVAPGAVVYGGSININGNGTGLVDRGAIAHLGFLNVDFESGDCIVLGDMAHPGRLQVGGLAGGSCGGYAVHVANAGSVLRTDDFGMAKVHGGKPPYFFAERPTALGSNFYVGKLETDLGAANPFAGFVLSHGAEPAIHDIGLAPWRTACAGGLGAGGCRFLDGDIYEGIVLLSPRGPDHSGGTVTLTLPIPARAMIACSPRLQAGSAGWPPGSTVAYAQQGENRIGFSWTSPALLAGGTYEIAYSCWMR